MFEALAVKRALNIGKDWISRRSLSNLMILLYIFAVILSLSTGLLFAFRSSSEALDYDEWEYWTLSSDLLRGQFNDPGRRTLGFPVIIAALRLVKDDFNFIQISMTFLASFAPPILAWLTHRITGSKIAAVIAAVGLACWPPHLFLASSLYSELLALPILLLFLGVLPIASDTHSNPYLIWIVGGLLLGLLSHIRTMYQLFIPFLLIVMLVEGGRLKLIAMRWLLVIGGFLLIVSPWSLYVSEKAGSPMLLTANGGETLAGGFNSPILRYETEEIKAERRSAWVGPGKWIPFTETGYLTKVEAKLPYTERDRLLRERTLNWLKENPSDGAYLVLRKLLYQWGLYPFDRSSLFQIAAGNVPSIFLLLSATLCLLFGRTTQILPARIWLMPIFTAGIAIISWGSWRFRHPADAALIVVVAVTIALYFERRPQPNKALTESQAYE